MKPDVLEKLDNCLAKGGFDLLFEFDGGASRFLESWREKDYADYISFSLRAATGLLADSCLRLLHKKTMDMYLVNKMTALLCESGDEDLKAVAWNTFLSCRWEEGFVLGDEMYDASTLERQALDEPDFPFWNKTPEAETERLFVRPLLLKDADGLVSYIKRYDKAESDFAYVLDSWRSIATAVFGLYPKDGEDGPIGLISILCYNGKNKGPAELSYYIKRKCRRKGYMKEGLSAVIDLVRKKRFKVSRPFRRAYIYEDAKPEITELLIGCDKSNAASWKLAESLGFSMAEIDFGLNLIGPPGRKSADEVWYYLKVE